MSTKNIGRQKMTIPSETKMLEESDPISEGGPEGLNPFTDEK